MSGPPARPDGPRWGRWGVEDERGALNLVTPAVVRAAAELVRRGQVYPLAQLIGRDTPAPPERPGPQHFMNRDQGDYAVGGKQPGGFQYAEDTVVFSTHVATHIDALAHAWYDDTLYNGFPAAVVRSTTGAGRCGVDKLGPIVTRGILLDLTDGGAALSQGHAVTGADLAACAERQGVAVQPGDAVLVRTGWASTWATARESFYRGEPGLDLGAARWLADHDVAVVGADNYAIEAIPFPPGSVFPVHLFLLRDCGVPLIENADLDRLAGDRCYEFLFVAAPLPIQGGTGSPLLPIAVA